jgi:TPR repeat protein
MEGATKMNMSMEEVNKIRAEAASGDAAAIKQLAAMHMYGAFPGADPQEGVRLLKNNATPPNYGIMLELGLEYLKGQLVGKDVDEGLRLIEQGAEGFGDDIHWGHCYEKGIAVGQIEPKTLRTQKLSAYLLEKLVNNAEGMAMLEQQGGQQGTDLIKGLLYNIKGWIKSMG